MASSTVNFSEEGSTDTQDSDYELSSIDSDSVGSVSLDIEEDMLVDARYEEDVDTSMTHTVYDPFLYMLCPDHKEDTELRQLYKGEEYEELSDDDFQVSNLDRKTDEETHELGVEYNVHNPMVDWKKMKPALGDKYESPEELKFCITNYAVANGYHLRFDKSEKTRLLVLCGKKEEGNKCPYRLFASWIGDETTFQIKSLNDKHRCSRNYSLGSLVTPSWIAKHYLTVLIRNPHIKIKDMRSDIKRRFICAVSRGQCQRARRKAFFLIDGKLSDHYARVWDYAHEILRSNPGSTVKVGVKVNPDATYFQRIYICFKALKDGWKKGCRQVIGLDGCFLKGRVKGELLSAIGRDANNQIYPIAWAVVDVENKDNWKWFIELLDADLGSLEGRGLTLISDQHKGLVDGVKEVMPYAEHRQCARHIYANFRKNFNGVIYRNMFWRASVSTTEEEFKNNMEELRSFNQSAYDHLIQRNPDTWCRAFFIPNRACEAVENGLSESFNSVIVEARRKPLLTMLEEIRLYCMERFQVMSTKAQTWENNICPNILKKMEKFQKNMRNWVVIPTGGGVFELRNGYDAFKVDIEAQYCTCRLWELSGIPCVHASAALNFSHIDPADYVSTWFSKEKFQIAYTNTIDPMNGSKMWPKTPYIKPLPPIERRMPGRPTIKRKRHKTENKSKYPTVSKAGRSITCRNCLQVGHNARSCKNDKQVPPPKQRKTPGRPRNKDFDDYTRFGTRATRGGRGGRVGKGGRSENGGRGGRVENPNFEHVAAEEVVGMVGAENVVEEVVRDENVVEEVVGGENVVDEVVGGGHFDENVDDHFGLESQVVFDDGGVPVTQTQDVPETQFGY